MVLSGSHFSHAASLLSLVSCRFNNTRVKANFVSAQSVHCAAPQHDPAIVPIEMTNNMLQFTAAGILYTYVSSSLQRAFPSVGPILGGSRVSISVGWLTPPPAHSSIRCHFGTEVVRCCPNTASPAQDPASKPLLPSIRIRIPQFNTHTQARHATTHNCLTIVSPPL